MKAEPPPEISTVSNREIKIRGERRDSLALVAAGSAILAFILLVTSVWVVAPVVLGLGAIRSYTLVREGI